MAADGNGFWVAIDLMRRGEKVEKISVAAADFIALGEYFGNRILLLLPEIAAAASIFFFFLLLLNERWTVKLAIIDFGGLGCPRVSICMAILFAFVLLIGSLFFLQ